MKTKNVIIIGAGIGGIVAATHLAQHGIKVTVIEKNSHPGRRCDRISRDGHHFDTDPTLLVMPLLYEAEFTALGTSMSEVLDLQRVDPTYHLVFDDGSQLALNADEENLTEAYQHFKDEAQALKAAYAPETVNTDGWSATQRAWLNLFPMIILIECFLHAFIKIRE